MARRIVSTTVVVALLGVVVQSPAVLASAPRAAGWIVTRTGPGPAVLRGTFHGAAMNAESMAMLFALHGKGARRTTENAFTTARLDWGADGSPRVYGSTQPDCLAACTDPVDTPFSIDFHSNGHRIQSVVYVATWDVRDASVTVHTPGWKVRRWLPSMRVVTVERTGDVGVRALHSTVGHFTGATAPGGRYGSIAWAHLPCNERGDGRAVFTGGRRRWPLDCAARFNELDFATAATEWRLTGEAVGVGSVVNVLVVVDFPPD